MEKKNPYWGIFIPKVVLYCIFFEVGCRQDKKQRRKKVFLLYLNLHYRGRLLPRRRGCAVDLRRWPECILFCTFPGCVSVHNWFCVHLATAWWNIATVLVRVEGTARSDGTPKWFWDPVWVGQQLGGWWISGRDGRDRQAPDGHPWDAGDPQLLDIH